MARFKAVAKIDTKTNLSDIKERKVSPDTLTEAVHTECLELDNTMDVKMLSESFSSYQGGIVVSLIEGNIDESVRVKRVMPSTTRVLSAVL